MNTPTSNNECYQLGSNYRLSRISGKDCSVILRNANDEIQAVMDVCNNKISHVGGYQGERLTTSSRNTLIDFIKSNNLSMTLSAARDLGINIYQPDKGNILYLDEKELNKKLKENISKASLIINNYKKHQMKIKSSTKGLILDLSRAAIKKLVIEENCNLGIDLRDNPYIESLIIKEGFAGNINLSRNSIKKIYIAENCRCEMKINDSLRCFSLQISDVFSGALNIKNSCFHKFKIGYYCYADINLSSDWGKKNIIIGDSFRGKLNVDNVHVSTIKIGNDCKGKINISSDDDIHGASYVNIADEFNGSIDLSNLKTLSHLKCGEYLRGKINLLGCQALKTSRLGEHFRGEIDFSESSIEYLRIAKDCHGEILMLGCDNLTLIKMPNEKQKSVTIDRSPLKIINRGNNVYYSFYQRILPKEYFTPFYIDWLTAINRLFKEKIYHENSSV